MWAIKLAHPPGSAEVISQRVGFVTLSAFSCGEWTLSHCRLALARLCSGDGSDPGPYLIYREQKARSVEASENMSTVPISQAALIGVRS